MSRAPFLPLLLAFLAIASDKAAALEIDFDGHVELESRHFPKPGRAEAMEENFTSLAGEFELGLYSRSGRHAVIVKPFGRYDQHDHERSHMDLREAKYRYLRGPFELTIGADKEFWGVTEFLHLVDIINQTDNVESVDGEAKLGQPMVKLAYSARFGTLTGYVLPFFRIRQYNGPVTGRPNLGFVVDDNTSLFESREARRTEDYALRYQHNIGPFDVGLSGFKGTSRDPQLLATGVFSAANNLPKLQAYYAYQTQIGLDVQATLGSWLWKLEAAQGKQNRFAGPVPTLNSAFDEVDYTRATWGFEYTFYNLFNSGTDVGLVTEHMWDDREEKAPHPFDNDIGIGFRWTANDTQSTAVLLGGLIDIDTRSTAISVEAERRLGQSYKVTLEARFQDKVGDDDAFAEANADEDFVRLRLAYFF